MSSTWGNNIKISIFGESHGVGIGVVIDGLPAGEELDFDEIQFQMNRRAPGNDSSSTPRKEEDMPEVCSGILNNVTTGAPLCAVIENSNTRSVDYDKLQRLPRPGHADYTGAVRYNGYNDVRGGGHFSGRLTAPLTFAGAVCRQILARRGVTVGGHIYAIGNMYDDPFDPVSVNAEQLLRLQERFFALNRPEAERGMRRRIDDARSDHDSVGGIVEIAAVGVPAGIGSPMFGGVENVLASIVYGVPAVKGNVCGGILGGISDGMPIILRAAVKPTPSISQEQHTVDLKEQRDAILTVGGRHDPCIVPRALPAIESAVAIGLAELMKEVGRL